MRRSTGGGVVAGVVALALGACHEPAPSEHRGLTDRPDDEGPGAAVTRGQPGGAAGDGDASGLDRVSAIAAGYLHSCAIVSGGEVFCWGSNYHGQLGDGTTFDQHTPVSVVQSPGGPPLAGVRALVLSAYQSCAIVSGGEVFCWGSNGHGQLGDGTTIDRLTPVPVVQSPGGPPLAGVQAMALGDYHTCALTVGGRVSCWGSNSIGQLGDGTTTDRLTPAPVVRSPGGPPLEGVQTLAAGSHFNCATVAGGRTLCWGDNHAGQLGDGAVTSFRRTPVATMQSPGGPPLEGVQALALGYAHTCAITSAGHVLCWGTNFFGELGDGTKTDRFYPTPVVGWPGGPPLEGVQSVAVGYSFGNCLTMVGDQALCWGWNLSGQIGDGTTTPRLTPVPVVRSPGGPPLVGVQAVASGSGHSCAKVGGEVLCWGRNDEGELGDGTAIDRLTPVAVALP